MKKDVGLLLVEIILFTSHHWTEKMESISPISIIVGATVYEYISLGVLFQWQTKCIILRACFLWLAYNLHSL